MRIKMLAIAGMLLVSGLLCAEGTVTLNGTVTGPQDAVVEGAVLKLYRISMDMSNPASFKIVPAGETKSDAKGQFAFTPKEAGAEGYSYYTCIGSKEGLSCGWKTLLQQNQNLDIRLTGPQKIIGHVQDPEGKGIADAEVRLVFLSMKGQDYNFTLGLEPIEQFAAKTCEQGRFEFNGLPEGATAEILVKKEGRGFMHTLTGNPDFQAGLTYAAGQTDIQLTMQKPCTISGIVMAKNGQKPVEGISIVLTQDEIPLSMFGVKPIVSAADGTFEISQLPRGKYSLAVSHPDWLSEPVSVDVQGDVGTKIELQKGGRLEVRVVEDATGQAVEGVSINISGQGNQLQAAVTDKSGMAQRQLSAGNYEVRAFKQGYRTSGDAAMAVVENDKTAQIEIRLGSPAKLTGIVKQPDGKPARGVRIQVFPSQGMGDDVSTKEDGRFEMAWNPEDMGWTQGEFLLSAFDKNNNMAITEPISADSKDLTVTLRPGCRVKGRVINEEGKPMKNAQVTLTIWGSRWGSSFGTEVKTDADGQYVFTSLPADQKFGIGVSNVKGYGSGSSRQFTTEAGAEGIAIEEIKLRLANLTLSGQAVDVEGKGLENVQVYMNGEGQPNESVKTDKEGKFKFDHVCPGPVSLHASSQSSNNYVYANLRTEGGAQDVTMILSNNGSYARFEPKKPAPLKGKPLPDLAAYGVEIPADANSVLVFVWDMQQRPSRHFVKELAAQKELLESKGVKVVLLNASKVEKESLDKWLADNQVAYSCGIINGDSEKAVFDLGVQGFPWLILTGKDKNVAAEGFAIEELTEKINSI